MRRWIPVLALIALTGCQTQSYSTRAPVSSEPLTIDPAMQQRQWEPMTAYYENGQTRSWTTGLAYSPYQSSSPYSYAFTDTGTFLLNLVTMPYTIYKERNGVVSGGIQLPPSYTANPPLPPSTQPPP
jgi:hypothetical protein